MYRSFYGYLSPTGNLQIVLYSFYGFLSSTGKSSIHPFSRRGYILLPFFCYGYLSPTGNRQIVLHSFYGFLSPTGKSSTYLFSRREFISIEKHYKRCCFPVGDLFYYVSFAMVIYPLRGIFYISFFPEGIYIHRKTL